MRTYRFTPRTFAYDLVKATFECTYLSHMKGQGDTTITDEALAKSIEDSHRFASRAAVFCGAQSRRGYTRGEVLWIDAAQAFEFVSSGIKCDVMGLFPEFFDATVERVEKKIQERYQFMVAKLTRPVPVCAAAAP